MAARTVVAKKSASTAPVRKVSLKSGAEKTVLMHAYVPDLAIAKNYVPRQVWGVFDKIVADEALAKALNMLLMGDTGAGKTLFGEAYAAHERLPYYSLPCDVSIDPSSLFGRRQPSSKPGVFPWVDGPVTWIVRNGGVLNISEINFMTPKIAASLYPLLDGRRYIPLLGHEGEVVRAHIGTAATSADGSPRPCWCDLTARECNKRRVLIIADMNPNYRGTMELNAAFKNRFEFKIPWNYDSEVEEKLIHFPTMRKIAGRLRELAGTDIMTPVSTNMMMEFEQFSMSPNLSLEFAVANFVSAFLPDEQNSVQNVFDLNKTDLSGDIAYFIKQSRRRNKKVDDDDDAEEIDFDFSQED